MPPFNRDQSAAFSAKEDLHKTSRSYLFSNDFISYAGIFPNRKYYVKNLIEDRRQIHRNFSQ